MKKRTKEKLIKGGIVGALGAAAAGGAAYLLSNKKARNKLGKVVKALEVKGEVELDKVLKSVKKAKKKSEQKVKEVLKDVNNKAKTLT